MRYTEHEFAQNPPLGQAGTPVSLTATGDILNFRPAQPARIVRWGFIATTTVTGSPVLTGNLRPTAGSTTGQTVGATTQVSAQTGYNASGQPAFYYDAAGGSMTPTGSQLPAAGKGIYHTVNAQAPSGTPALYPQPDTANVPPGGVDTQLMVYPGQEFAINVGTAASAGAGVAWVEYIEEPFVDLPYNGDASQIPAAISPTPSNSCVNLTKVLS